MPKNNLEETIKLLPKIISYSPKILIEGSNTKDKNIKNSSISSKKELTIYSTTFSNIYFACDPVGNFNYPESIQTLLSALPKTSDKIYLINETSNNEFSLSSFAVNSQNETIDAERLPDSLKKICNINHFKVKDIPFDRINMHDSFVVQINYYTNFDTNFKRRNQQKPVEHIAEKAQLIDELIKISNTEKVSIVFLDNQNKTFTKTMFLALTRALKKSKDNDLSFYENLALSNSEINPYTILLRLPTSQAQSIMDIPITNIFTNDITTAFNDSFELNKYITLKKYFNTIKKGISKAEKFIFGASAENMKFSPAELELKFIKNDIEHASIDSHEAQSFEKKLHALFTLAKENPSLTNTILETNTSDIVFIYNKITAIKRTAIAGMFDFGVGKDKIEQQKNANEFTNLLTSLIAIIDKLQLLSKPPLNNQINNNNNFRNNNNLNNRNLKRPAGFNPALFTPDNSKQSTGESNKLQKTKFESDIGSKSAEEPGSETPDNINNNNSQPPRNRNNRSM